MCSDLPNTQPWLYPVCQVVPAIVYTQHRCLKSAVVPCATADCAAAWRA